MTVIKTLGGTHFVIYLPRTSEDKINDTHPQVIVKADGLTSYTLAALEYEAEKTERRLAREQRKAELEHEYNPVPLISVR